MTLLKEVLMRFGLLILVVILGFVSLPIFNFINVDLVQFSSDNPFSGYVFLGFAALLGWTFWMGVVFGTIGKTIDYALIVLTTLLIAWAYINTNTSMYIALAGAAIVGNIIGYLIKLKLGRQKWFPKYK